MTRNPNKTVDGGAKDSALPPLTPNTGPLIVGDVKTPAQQKPQKPKRVPFGSYMDPELQRQFKAECVLMGIEMQAALDEAVRDWMAKYPRPGR